MLNFVVFAESKISSLGDITLLVSWTKETANSHCNVISHVLGGRPLSANSFVLGGRPLSEADSLFSSTRKERKFETKQNLTLCYYELIQRVNERKTQPLIICLMIF
jgi:hypothetical protein